MQTVSIDFIVSTGVEGNEWNLQLKVRGANAKKVKLRVEDALSLSRSSG